VAGELDHHERQLAIARQALGALRDALEPEVARLLEEDCADLEAWIGRRRADAPVLPAR
jgi:hypothetical protein